MPVSIVGLLVAAGTGDRLGAGGPKAFVECAGRSLLAWSLDALSQVCDRVVVAVPPGYEGAAGRSTGYEGAAGRSTGGSAAGGSRSGDVAADRVIGGSVRSASVRAALEAAPEARIAVVHDAARPLVTPGLVEACVAGLGDRWDGAVAAARATDTLKEARPEDGAVVRTLDRELVWVVQTPQVFRAEALRAALDVDDEALARASDDAALVEAAGGAVRVVEAPAENLKVTTPVDLEAAAVLLRARGGPC